MVIEMLDNREDLDVTIRKRGAGCRPAIEAFIAETDKEAMVVHFETTKEAINACMGARNIIAKDKLNMIVWRRKTDVFFAKEVDNNDNRKESSRQDV